MIKSILFTNFKGFKKHFIEFKDLNIIVGINNAGKSTVVEALRIISLVTNKYKNLNYRKTPEDLIIADSEYGVKPAFKNVDINFDTINYLNDSDSPAIIEANFDNDLRIIIYLNNTGNIHAVIKSNNKIISSKREAALIHLPQINILPQIGPLIKEEYILEQDYVKATIGSTLSSYHFRNHIYLNNDLMSKFQEIVTSTWPKVKINDLEKIESENNKKLLFLEIRNDNFAAEVSSMGHGLQMWLQIIWFITMIKDAQIVIMDEPDIYMHADLQKKLIRLIKNKYPQVILTTHSIEIMSEVDAKNILIVDKGQNQSHFATDIPAIQRILNSFGSFHNISMTRLWRSKKFLMVEGKDLKYLKIIQDKLFPNSTFPFDSIPNISIGGWGGWNNVVGTSMILVNSFNEKINIFCILDSDYHQKKEIEKRMTEAKKNDIRLHIWQKKEIENFFIIPSLILRVIKKNTKITKTPTIADIEKEIKKICNKLKVNAIDLIATELQRNNKGLVVKTANEEAREIIDKTKKDEGNILSLLSGKEVISQLSEWSQKNFNTSISYNSLCYEINKDEIDKELLEIILSIENNKDFNI